LKGTPPDLKPNKQQGNTLHHRGEKKDLPMHTNIRDGVEKIHHRQGDPSRKKNRDRGLLSKGRDGDKKVRKKRGPAREEVSESPPQSISTQKKKGKG